jgi:hypothetical protein
MDCGAACRCRRVTHVGLEGSLTPWPDVTVRILRVRAPARDTCGVTPDGALDEAQSKMLLWDTVQPSLHDVLVELVPALHVLFVASAASPLCTLRAAIVSPNPDAIAFVLTYEAWEAAAELAMCAAVDGNGATAFMLAASQATVGTVEPGC